MADYTILIQVDPHTREFLYTDQDSGDDVETIVLVNGDRLVWVLDPSLPERTFQIDFGILNPFHVGQVLSFRGSDFVVSPGVRLPVTYAGARNFKYTVSLGNGWQDDPDCIVVPEPPDPPNQAFPTPFILQTLLTATNTIIYNISWTDASETQIKLTKPTQAVKASATSNRATVMWQWDPNQPDPQPFTLQFANNPPPGWPKTALTDPESITLSLPPGAATNFTITTTTPDQTATPYTTGSLEIDVAPQPATPPPVQ